MNILTEPLLATAHIQLKEVVAELDTLNDMNRTDLGDIRVAVTAALCRIVTAERQMVGVPAPRRGD